MTPSTTTTTTPEADAYIEAVRAELVDLTDEERGELLEDLAGHLAELTADPEHGTDPAARLGPPAQYAAELRGAAGLPPSRDAADVTTAAALGGRLARPVREWPLVRAAEDAWRHPYGAAVRSFVDELRPAWWVLRGYLVVLVFAGLGGGGYADIPIPRVLGSRVLGLAAIVAAVLASVRIGRDRPTRLGRVLVLVANIVLTVIAFGFATNMRLGSQTQVVVYEEGRVAALESPHGPVTNIYPYASDGTPLDGVLLFDQDGRPLRTADQQWWADGCARMPDHPRAADGVPVEFAYPHDYVPLPGQGCTGAVARPPVPLPTFPPADTTAGPVDDPSTETADDGAGGGGSDATSPGATGG